MYCSPVRLLVWSLFSNTLAVRRNALQSLTKAVGLTKTDSSHAGRHVPLLSHCPPLCLLTMVHTAHATRQVVRCPQRTYLRPSVFKALESHFVSDSCDV
jgi:hypothetical protein